MKKRCRTVRDGPGTAASIIGGVGCGVFYTIAFGGPVGLAVGVLAAFLTKHETGKEAADKVDRIAGDNPDKMAREFRRRNPTAKKSDVTVTSYPDVLIPLPRTRGYTFRYDDEAEE